MLMKTSNLPETLCFIHKTVRDNPLFKCILTHPDFIYPVHLDEAFNTAHLYQVVDAALLNQAVNPVHLNQAVNPALLN